MFSLSLGRILRVWSTFWAHVQLINATEFSILSLFCCLAGKCFIVVLSSLPLPLPIVLLALLHAGVGAV